MRQYLLYVFVYFLNLSESRDPKYYAATGRFPKWRRSVEIMDRWAPKVPDSSESLYTIVMDVCEGAEQHAEVLGTFKKMTARNIKGSKSAFAFIIRACNKLLSSELALEAIEEYRRTGSAAAYMYEEAAALAESTGKIEHAVKAFARAAGDSHLDRPVSPFMSKKIVSGSLDALSRMDRFLGSNYSHSSIQDTCCAHEQTSEFSAFAYDIYLCLKAGILDSSLTLTAPAIEVASKFLLQLDEYDLVQKMLNNTALVPANVRKNKGPASELRINRSGAT